MPIAGWVAMAVLAWLGVAVWAAITFLASTVTGSAAAAAGVGFVALLVLSIVGAIPNVGRFLPAGLAEPAVALATGGPSSRRCVRAGRLDRRPHRRRPARERRGRSGTRSSEPRTQTTPRERSAAIASGVVAELAQDLVGVFAERRRRRPDRGRRRRQRERDTNLADDAPRRVRPGSPSSRARPPRATRTPRRCR